MSVQTWACIVFVILSSVVVNAEKPPGTPPDQESSEEYSFSSRSSSRCRVCTCSTESDGDDDDGDGDESACDRNSTYKSCPNPCPKTCQNPKGVSGCGRKCVAEGCECKRGYVLSDNDKCVKLEDCPDYLRCKDRNAIYKQCPNPCPNTCALPGLKPCGKACVKEGCECKPGFYLNDQNLCVQLHDCPEANKCSTNETFVFCKVDCPSNKCPENDNRFDIACSPPYPCRSGCSCKEDYLRSNEDDTCLLYSDCQANKCSTNETFVFCKVDCPSNKCPENDNRFDIACSPPYPCRSGCSCKEDYLRSNEDDTCLLYSDCPSIHCTRPNEVYCARPPPCIFDKCEDLGKSNECDRNYPSPPQCVCELGHYRNKHDICVPKKQCPKPLAACGLHEVPAECRIQCPPQSCDVSYTDYFCGANIQCEPGCNCRQDYLRNATGHCIPRDDCPPPPTIPVCNENEQPSMCKIVCPPQSCASLYTLYLCQENITCEWGCNCIEGYLRDDRNVCVPSQQCSSHPPDLCGHNEVLSECAKTCPPQTCDSIFSSYLCSNETICELGCDCCEGYLRNASGICVPSEECFPGCDGDPNAEEVSSPWPRPSTCNSPEAGTSGKPSKPLGCQCKPGYILSESRKQCILPNDCKCGNPCGANGTFSECAFRCPSQYCPEDDSQVEVACKPGRPCPSGCLCKPNYLRNSYVDETCVLASDCRRVECSRPNEVWTRCATECLAESCDDLLQQQPECFPEPGRCKPQCVCEHGYYRNKSGICIPKEECPTKCEVNQECRATCATPSPAGCELVPLPPATSNVDSCNCQAGHVLSARGGICINIEDCPTNQTCNGDPNAFITRCPQPCPSSCKSPDAFPCKRKCVPIGCQCKPGFLKSDDGKCILPDQCPGGHPCGENEDFVVCRYECPTNYCPTDDSRASVVCETDPFAECYSGCACRLNHRRCSRDNPKCIVSSDCPAVDCSARPHEIWSPCPEECTSEYCEAVDSPPAVCNTLLLNCSPMCRCEKGYYRNGSDICVSARECRRVNRETRLVHIGSGN